MARQLTREAEESARFVSPASHDHRDLLRLATALDGVDDAQATEVLAFAEAVVHLRGDREYLIRDLSEVAWTAASLGE
ncbi:hypothetical protein [Micromonospora sp. NPDC000729]|uniref:hypothetical protein n=1 Tax=Micromonospora sp. NPDC000729 TaxID=3364220 RepID=UPI0008DADCF0|nr:hypothetical protein BFV98_10715 [Micromonospora sp. WMMB235]